MKKLYKSYYEAQQKNFEETYFKFEYPAMLISNTLMVFIGFYFLNAGYKLT